MSLNDLPYAYGAPTVNAQLKHRPEDFVVEEVLGFEPDGEGEHVFLFVEKKNINTEQLARQLARIAKLPVKQVSFSGMKDKRAVTRQWFSLHLPGKTTPVFQDTKQQGFSVLASTRHRKKLRRGTHQFNRFCIRLSQCEGDMANLVARFKTITEQGVPNYFGEQRFGIDGNNLEQAKRWFAGEITVKRHRQSLYLSAARSYLFNQILAQRVKEGSWNKILADEIVMFDGSNALFCNDHDDSLQQRLDCGELHPSGPLYGLQKAGAESDSYSELEQAILDRYPLLTEGLRQQAVAAQRRALRSMLSEVSCQVQSDSEVVLKFSLVKGCFATVVMRELAHFKTLTT